MTAQYSHFWLKAEIVFIVRSSLDNFLTEILKLGYWGKKKDIYKSSSSSGRAVSCASLMSCSIFCCHWGSIVTWKKVTSQFKRRGARDTEIGVVSNSWWKMRVSGSSYLWGHKGWHGNELQVGVSNQLPGEMFILVTWLPRTILFSLPSKPQEWLLKVVVGLGRDVIILKVLLAVEDDGLGLDLPVLDVHLVASQNNGNVLANPDLMNFIRGTC